MTAAAERARPLPEPDTRALQVALVGNPNCGKSTLFNALTGRRQRVANFPGVTVERAEGEYRTELGPVSVIDLPGTYSLSPESPDEAIALDVLLGRADGVPPLDVVVIVADAENLERNLYLATEVLELGRPTVIALNRADRLERAGVQIDVVELIHELGVVVVPVVATRGEGVDRLRHAIHRAASLPRTTLHLADDDAGNPEREAHRRYQWISRVIDRTVIR
ncbi:MAG: FeoB small GTPase domain-containing protein, partial [Gemmatimonadaceae bacterium]